jgi:hypothetical protein|tara:strand:- start:21 stop:632 length:612 start_codon:yes stop_codon:yes gene_type:complete
MGLISNGTTVFDAGSMASGFGSSMVFIKKLTASGSANLTFHNGTSNVILDSTYKEYLFTFKNIHLASNTPFNFQVNAVGASGFNETISSTSFFMRHAENGDGDQLSYSAANDQAQGTGFQRIATDQGTGNDENMGGFLRLFNPASTTFVKHFISNCQSAQATDYSMNRMVGGYINTTAAIDEIQFKAESGNIDAGDICLYGIA